MERSWADLVKAQSSNNFDKVLISTKIKKRVVVNKTWGGFVLSNDAKGELFDIKNKIGFNIDNNIKRDDGDLINVIMKLGEEQSSGDVYGIKMKTKYCHLILIRK